MKNYKLVRRHTHYPKCPTVAITKQRRIWLNAKAAVYLKSAGAKRVVILWDPESHSLAIVPADEDNIESYSLCFDSGLHQSAAFAPKDFLRSIGWRCDERVLLPTSWNAAEGMLEVVLPAEHLVARPADENQIPVESAEPKRKRSMSSRESRPEKVPAARQLTAVKGEGGMAGG